MRIFPPDPDTGMGGNQQRFPVTRQSAIIATRSEDTLTRQLGFEIILKNYWKPVYKYLRLKWHCTNEDAKDLTQSFFTAAFEKNYFGAYDSEKARFQTYVRMCLDAFVNNERKSSSRLKRGGSFSHVSIDFVAAEEEVSLHVLREQFSPDKFFYQEWIRNLFSLAVGTMRERLESTGRKVNYQLFERYDLIEHDEATKPSYASLAAEFGLEVNTVTNRLASARREFRNIVVEALREMTVTDDEFRSEARTLLGISFSSKV